MIPNDEYAVKVLNPEIMKNPEVISNMIYSERITKALENRIPLIRVGELDEKQIQQLNKEYYLIYPWS